jgi:para-aminobenzoate synthetase/4-amino-4-deoxychorismate lyase
VALFVTYEAAPAFDPAMHVCTLASAFAEASVGRRSGLPFAWAAEFDALVPEAFSAPGRLPRFPTFEPSLTQDEFRARVARVQEHIADGDTYQVNLTFPLTAEAPADAAAWYTHLRAAQRAAYAAYLDLGPAVVISLSPELFFEIGGGHIRARPMKGTIRRGRWLAEDETLARALAC